MFRDCTAWLSTSPRRCASRESTALPGIIRGMKKLMVMAAQSGEQVEAQAAQEVPHGSAPSSSGASGSADVGCRARRRSSWVPALASSPSVAAHRPLSRPTLPDRVRPCSFSPPSSPNSQQATQWSGASPTSVRSGTSDRHTSIAFGQRGWNRQPARRVDQARRFAGVLLVDGLARAPDAFGIRRRVDQQVRVGVRGVLRHRLAVAALDHAPGVHHQRLVGEVARRGDVVGDVEHCQVQPRPSDRASRFSTPSRIETSSIETGSSASSASGSAASARAMRHALALAAGQLVRVLVQVQLGRRQLDPAQQLGQRLARPS